MTGCFRCNECGTAFDKPKIMLERHGMDSPPYEEWALCPYCFDSNIEEITKERYK